MVENRVLVIVLGGRSHNPTRETIREPTARIIDVALRIGALLFSGDCRSVSWLMVELDESDEIIYAALNWLERRGVYIDRRPLGKSNCLMMQILNVSWEDARLGELAQLGLLRRHDWMVPMFGLSSAEYQFADLVEHPGPPALVESVAELRSRLEPPRSWAV